MPGWVAAPKSAWEAGSKSDAPWEAVFQQDEDGILFKCTNPLSHTPPLASTNDNKLTVEQLRRKFCQRADVSGLKALHLQRIWTSACGQVTVRENVHMSRTRRWLGAREIWVLILRAKHAHKIRNFEAKNVQLIQAKK